MPVSCAANGCTERFKKGNNISFHRFPLHKESLLKRWLINMKRPDWMPTKYQFVCSKHFEDQDFRSRESCRRKLKEDAVPSVFCFPPNYQKNSRKIRTKNSRKKQPKPILEELGSKNDIKNEAEQEMVLEQQNEHISIHDDGITMEEEDETAEKLEETTISIPLCRLCASPSLDVISIFENKQLAGELLEKIHTYLPIMITVEDLLPTTVCGKCINRLEICHSLVQDCLDADVTLKTMFGLQNSNQVQNSNKNSAGKHFGSSCHTKDAFNNPLEKSNQSEDYMNLTDIKFEVESNNDEADTSHQNAVESNGIVEVETSNQNAVESNGIVKAKMSKQNAVESNGIMEAETSNQKAVESNGIVEAEISNQIAVEKNSIRNNDAIQNLNKVTIDTRTMEESGIEIVNIEPKMVNKSRKRKRNPKLKFLVVKKKADKNMSEEVAIQKMLEFALKKMNTKRTKTQMPKEKHKPREMPSVDNSSVATHKEISKLKDTDQNVGHVNEEIAEDHTYTRKEQEESVDCEKT